MLRKNSFRPLQRPEGTRQRCLPVRTGEHPTLPLLIQVVCCRNSRFRAIEPVNVPTELNGGVLDHSTCLTQYCYFRLSVVHDVSPFCVELFRPLTAGRNTVAGCRYALIGICRCL